MSSLTSTPSLASTQAFIDDHPIDVVLVRTPQVSSGAGGWVDGAPQYLPPQRMRLVAQSQLQSSSQTRAEGDVSVPRWTLVAMPDADLERGDTFLDGDASYRVIRVDMSPPWAKRGAVIEDD